jgi:predicted alpha/beta hydrolase family esterase
MNQIILIHGLPSKEDVLGDIWPSPSNSHWFPWIQQQLTRKDILCQTLEMPLSYNPDYKTHERVLSQMEISDETILVGHSCGGGFLVRYFSEHKELRPKKIILVAPWIDLENYLKELNPNSDFFDFEIDIEITKRTKLYCMISSDDGIEIIDSVNKLERELPDMLMHNFTDKGHFTEPDLGTKEFPELLELILKQ